VTDLGVELLVLLGLVGLNGLFSGSEMAMVSVRRTRIAELVESGAWGAKELAELRGDPERLLATVQVGITVVGASAAAFGGSSIADRLVPWIAAVPLLASRSEALAFGLVVVMVSVLSIVLGELVPKSIALRSGERYALLVAPVMHGLATLARPVVWALTSASNVLLSVFGDRTSFTEARHSPEELQQLVEEAANDGTLGADVGSIALRAFDFDGLDAASVMVPRPDLVGLPRDASLAVLADRVRRTGRTRILVYEGDLDGIVGFVNARDVLAESHVHPDVRLADHVRPVLFVPDTAPAPALLRQLQRERAAIAVVVDEAGVVRGAVTVDDLVEELVGEVLSEDDVVRDRVVREPDGAWLVQADVPLHELERTLDVELPDELEAATLAGLVLEAVGQIPRRGARVRAHGLELEVVDGTARRIKAVRVRVGGAEGQGWSQAVEGATPEGRAPEDQVDGARTA
jgi:putative hemolysin